MSGTAALPVYTAIQFGSGVIALTCPNWTPTGYSYVAGYGEGKNMCERETFDQPVTGEWSVTLLAGFRQDSFFRGTLYVDMMLGSGPRHGEWISDSVTLTCQP